MELGFEDWLWLRLVRRFNVMKRLRRWKLEWSSWSGQNPWAALRFAVLGLAAPCSAVGAAEFGEWKTLFDGTSTEAFRAWDGDYFPKEAWRIEGDTLKCLPASSRTPGARGDIVTRVSFEDFELRWEWKVSPRAESGLKYGLRERAPNARALFVGDNGRDPLGLEYQMLDDERHPEARRGLIRSTASLYDVFPRAGADPKTVGGWNASRLVVRGNQVEHWLNDVKVLQYDLGGEKLREALAKSKFRKVRGLGEKRASPILLEDNGSAIWFRNIRVREWKTE